MHNEMTVVFFLKGLTAKGKTMDGKLINELIMIFMKLKAHKMKRPQQIEKTPTVKQEDAHSKGFKNDNSLE
jgi:hypothetical protein